MTPAPTRETPAGQVYHDVWNLARRHGRDPAEYFTLYALEGFLARLAASEHSADFVLKGGVLMAAFAARRPTRDIDLAASGFPNDIDGVVQRVRSIAMLDTGDRLLFDAESIAGTNTSVTRRTTQGCASPWPRSWPLLECLCMSM
jgi:hypothetical protein